MIDDRNTYRLALEDFRSERSRAAMQQFWGALTGKSLDLLPFDEISTKLRATSKAERGLQNIPLSAIVGSVGRYDDFNRNFLPLLDNDMDRWARVKTAMTSASSAGVPPISVYKIGEVFFVLDGNHRVSIAKQMGMKTIEAYVTEIKTRVPLGAEVSPDQLILKEEYVNFLEQTELDTILPDVDFTLTALGQYELLKEHIRVHRYYMGVNQSREISYEEAVKDWYEYVYLPVISIIRESGLLDEFKGKTETDLYLWILDHQSQLQQELGWEIRTENAAEDLARSVGKQISTSPGKGKQHIEEVLGWTDVDTYDSCHGVSKLQPECLFRDILVAINGLESGWDALEQAIRINRCGDGEIRGLHIINEDVTETEVLEGYKKRFAERLAQVGVKGKLAVAEGDISKVLSKWSQLNDLLVLKLSYPPSASLFDRWSSGFSSILRNSKRPLLVVREQVTDLDRLLLAYDGSPKSKEALFVAAYFAARYGFSLDVITIDNGSAEIRTVVEKTKAYLERLNIQYSYIFEKGDVPELVISTIDQVQANLLLMGGYGHSSFMEVVFGSAVDPILRKISIPALICE
jgi:nucleotide-binding universal stress UspA family protein